MRRWQPGHERRWLGERGLTPKTWAEQRAQQGILRALAPRRPRACGRTVVASAVPERQSFGLADLRPMDNHGAQGAHGPASCGWPAARRCRLPPEGNEMIRNKRLSAIALSLAVALVSLPAAAKDKAKVAFIGPLTGGVAANGIGARNSAELAVKLRNADPKAKYDYELLV